MLRSLTIERDDASESNARSGIGMGAFIGGLVATLLIGVLAGWFLKPGAKASQTAASAAQTSEGADIAADAGNRPAASNAGLVASGYVVPRRRATVAAEVIGRVLEVRVEEGQTVRKGEILAILDATLARAELQSAQARVSATKADVAAIESDLAEAKRVLERTQALKQSAFASDASLTAAQSRVTTLQGRLAQANAMRVSSQRDTERAAGQLERFEIRAPFTGVVVDRAAQAGEIISPSSAGGGFTRTGICTLVDMQSLEIEVDVNEAYIARVKPDQKVEAVLDAYPDITFPAHVIATIPTASRDKATVRVRVGFDKLDPRILPEMAIKVTFVE